MRLFSANKSKTISIAGCASASFCTRLPRDARRTGAHRRKARPAIGNHQFAIENETFALSSPRAANDIGEVARKRLSGFRLQINFVAIAKR